MLYENSGSIQYEKNTWRECLQNAIFFDLNGNIIEEDRNLSILKGVEKMNKKITKIIYTAGVIADDTYKTVVNTENWPNKYVDHMTIQFGNLTERPDYIGKSFNFIATHVVSDDKGKAWIGYIDDDEIAEKMHELGQHAHITLFTAAGVKPVYSNELIRTVFPCELYKPIKVKMLAGMFVAYDDGSTGWEF